MHCVHVLFFLWGLAILGFHIHASVQPTLPQCLLQVRPWLVSRPWCFFLCLDCNCLGISGQLDEHAYQALSLEVLDIFTEFHHKIYNTTITEWGDSAAITNTNHPGFLSLMLARVNMTNGLLPAVSQSNDTPVGLYDFEMCITNIPELPDGLDSK
ncbi:hypothetical protein JG687_00004142 [Phytophthora cactorum]|uniref:Uncharacterized protein n=1 Tax=Phytophthora cactorum TaxID=29920 RepID=A0A8T1UU12_9STRA|nr:hypothetical protein JG687_00004142 [Phytophthora cactorum]